MLKVVDKVLNPTIFKILILITTLVMQVPFIHSAYGEYVKYVLAFGVIVLLRLAKEIYREISKDKANMLLVVFLCLYIISIILNRDSNVGNNIKQLVYMMAFFCLLFVVNRIDIRLISIIITIFTFLLSLICFITYVLNIKEWYMLDTYYFLGSWLSNLWGLYNPNTCGAIAVISIITSMYLLFSNTINKLLYRIITSVCLALNVGMQYLVLLLSSSRGAYYGFLATVLILIFIAIVKKTKRNKLNLVPKIFFAIIICVFVLAFLLKTSSFVQSNKGVFCVVSEESSNAIDQDTTFENALENLLKKYTVDSSALTGLFRTNYLSFDSGIVGTTASEGSVINTTGRDIIWKAAFKVFLEKPFFGWTREGLVEPTIQTIVSETGYDSSAVAGGGLHNLYLTILCSSGILGFICMMMLALIVLIRFGKCLLSKELINGELLFSFAMCLFFFISELVESRILYTVSFFNVVFWIYFGYLNYYSLKGNIKSEEKY